MASTNIDRTAVVKMALFGKVNVEEEMHDVSRMLHDFSYTVASEGGEDSYKFKIELVNSDESFIKSIISAYSVVLSSSNTDLIGQEDTLKSFPKLLIQFGYNNSLSQIHTAQVSNVTYKFTQGKEKIIIIEAVNAGDWASAFYEKAADVEATYSLNLDYVFDFDKAPNKYAKTTIKSADSTTAFDFTSSPNTTPYKLSDRKYNAGEILMFLISSLLKTVNGVEVENKINLESMDYEIATILKYILDKKLSQRIHVTAVTPKARTMRTPRNPEMANTQFYSTAYSPTERFLIQRRGVELRFETVKEFFKNFGVEVEYGIGQLDPSEKYLQITTTNSKEKGVYGNQTKLIPYSQLKDSSKVENLFEPIDNKIKSDLLLELDSTSNSDAAQRINQAVNIYNNDILKPGSPPTERVYASTAKLTVPITAEQQNAVGSRTVNSTPTSLMVTNGNGRTFNIIGLIVRSHDDRGNPLGSAGGQPINIKLTSNTTVSQGQTLGQYVDSVQYEIYKAKVEKRESDVFTEDQLETFGRAEAIIPVSELTDHQRAQLLFTNLKFHLHSPKGESTLDTVKNIIKSFNNMVLNSNNRISLREESPTSMGDFTQVYDSLNTDPELIDTTVFKLKTKQISNNDNREQLRKIESFPQAQYEGNDEVMQLSYGESNSIVEYFDFNGGVQVLANLLGAVALQENLENSYEYLSRSSLGVTVAPILEYILNDYVFIKKLEEDKSVNGEQLVKDLQNLIDQLKAGSSNVKNDDTGTQPVKTGTGISPELFENIGYIESYVQGQYIDDATDEDVDLRVNKYGHDYTALQRFLKAIAKTEHRKALFNITDISENQKSITINNYVSESEEDPELIEIPRTFVYTLVGSNVWDEYAKSKEAYGSLNANSTLLALDVLHAQSTFAWEIKVKTLGVPEMDTLSEISSPRKILFKVRDMSQERNVLTKLDQTQLHWLSGEYIPLAINHRINNSGYKTELKLIKHIESS